jgi:hypothetical protein
VLSKFVQYLTDIGGIAAISAILYYVSRAVALVLVVIVGICTSNRERRQACVDIARALCRGWPWAPRVPGAHG